MLLQEQFSLSILLSDNDDDDEWQQILGRVLQHFYNDVIIPSSNDFENGILQFFSDDF
jgi:hypothetical protein